MIRIESLSATFGADTPNPVTALDDITLGIAEREFVVVIGSNGSGKSTLLNVLAGTVRPRRGRVLIGNTDATRLQAHERARLVGRVFQNPFSGTAPAMTVAENLRLAELRGVPKGLHRRLDARRIGEYRGHVAELGMGLEDRMGTAIGLLSGGQRQALTLLMATLRRPEILLLDEHTAALDPGSAEQVLRLTDRLIERHRLTAMMVTHDMNEAARFGNRLLMMNAGRIVLDAAGQEKQALTPGSLLERFAEQRAAVAHAH
ncbi:MAG TPA: ATP-binding cassette domain-containing protein [Candidatus Kapabacteria bacterium]|nr:ATP-binding cassette domain-containing protein [Candidatus Kapabacteria bacterium]